MPLPDWFLSHSPLTMDPLKGPDAQYQAGAADMLTVMLQQERELLGMQIVATCQRVDCNAQESVCLDDLEGHERIAEITPGRIADGWGYDQEGVNRVLHCPAHRT